jgi:hypothetical protein
MKVVLRNTTQTLSNQVPWQPYVPFAVAKKSCILPLSLFVSAQLKSQELQQPAEVDPKAAVLVTTSLQLL